MRRLAILGSTGSIGTQALEVVSWHPDKLEVVALAAQANVDLIEEQVRKFSPKVAALVDEEAAKELRRRVGNACRVLSGKEALCEIAALPEADIVLTAVTGAAGLLPTLEALKANKDVALANKETLVAGGHLVTEACKVSEGQLLPVDSEHSALFQCLVGEDRQKIRRLFLTASGGPFRKKRLEELRRVTVKEALAHPTWNMGPKVTIDSATLMNKGLEIIEAHWLFGVHPKNIEVVIHPQSIIHSLVEFVDGSVKAQMGLPDMRLPIQYALLYPERDVCHIKLMDLAQIGSLTFEAPDLERFPCLRLAKEAAIIGGTMPAVLNAANEIAVQAFLSKRIPFIAIPAAVEAVMQWHDVKQEPSLQDILDADAWAREKAEEMTMQLALKESLEAHQQAKAG